MMEPIDFSKVKEWPKPDWEPGFFEEMDRFRAVHAKVCIKCGNTDPKVWRAFFQAGTLKVLEYKVRVILNNFGWDAAEEFLRQEKPVTWCATCYLKQKANGKWKDPLEDLKPFLKPFLKEVLTYDI